MDDELCWAYSVANVLQWWQDKQDDYYISLNSIPDGNTYSDAYVSDIVSTFVYGWKNNNGGLEVNGFAWWLADLSGEELIVIGVDEHGETIKETTFPEGGGYWTGFNIATEDISTQIAVAEDNATEEIFINAMDEAILAGYGMTLGIYTNAEGSHAITLWGYELDDDGRYWIYVTDSDDWRIGIYGMNRVEIVFDDAEGENVWYLQNYYGDTDWFVGTITTLEVGVLTVPEPATSLLSLMALAGMLARRRRKAA